MLCQSVTKFDCTDFCVVLGTKVDFMFPVETDDDDDGDDAIDSTVSKLADEYLPESVSNTFDITNDFDAPTDDEKSCFDFYG